ncbi:DMT family transporter [Tabrizicola soli]|uniref:EamA family transporter n=1 Tax=Tabrizicola soli TaxID=2185115 RepID=A0ABV7DNB1_9RHOB|nr:DMT family transporter [Tabrizicola soli]
MLAVVLSLAAAACFALGSLYVDGVSSRVGALQLVRWQMIFACLLTAAAALVLGGWRTVTADGFLWLAASSATGVMIGGLTYIAAIKTLGPRLFALFFTLSAPFALALGFLFRDETISPAQGLGVVLILAGIVLAILGPRGADGIGKMRTLGLGTALGLVTALMQALGNLTARPAMLAGTEPFTAIAIRTFLAVLFFALLLSVPRLRPTAPLALPDARRIGLSALTGMFIGMSLLMAALARGDVGIVTTLSSTTPILILPMVWTVTRRLPGPAAWAGAALAVAGTALISLA